MSFECEFAAMTDGRFKRNGVKGEFFTTVGYENDGWFAMLRGNNSYTWHWGLVHGKPVFNDCLSCW